MSMYVSKIHLRLRGHLVPLYITIANFGVDGRMHDTFVVLNKITSLWNDSNMKELEDLPLDELGICSRLFDPVWLLFKTGDYSHVRQFMEHDIFHVPLFKNGFLPAEEDFHNANFLYFLPEDQADYLHLMRSHWHDSSLPLRRLLKVICGIEAIRKIEFEADPPQKVLCLKTLFKYQREPYITSAEVRRVIRWIGREETSEDLFQQISDLFEAYFPESVQPYQPRSLKHLSRCQVRENLKAVQKYPEGVKMLPVPKPIKSYILIDYLPWVRENLSSCITFEIPEMHYNSEVTFRILNSA